MFFIFMVFKRAFHLAIKAVKKYFALKNDAFAMQLVNVRNLSCQTKILVYKKYNH